MPANPDTRIAITLNQEQREILQRRAQDARLPVATLGRLIFSRAIEAVATDDELFFRVLVAGSDRDVAPELEADMVEVGLEAVAPREPIQGRARRPVKKRAAGKATAKKPGGARPKRRARK